MSYIFLILSLAALAYQIISLICLVRFFRTPLPPGPASGPGVTVFKPLKGREPFTRECLASFLAQDYRPCQVLFGVADGLATSYTLVLHAALLLPPILLGFYYLWREGLSLGELGRTKTS